MLGTRNIVISKKYLKNVRRLYCYVVHESEQQDIILSWLSIEELKKFYYELINLLEET